MEVKVIGQMDNTIDHTFESANRVYDVSGLAPTVNTCGGGGLQPKVIEVTKLSKCIGGLSDNMWGKQYHRQDRVYSMGDIALALPSQLPGGSYNYLEVKKMENIEVLGNLENSSQRSVVYNSDAISPTLQVAMGTDEKLIIQKCGDRDKEGTYSVHDYSNCIPANPMSDRGQLLLEKQIVAMRGRDPENPSDRTSGNPNLEQRLEPNSQGICNTLTSVSKDNMVLEKKAIKIRQATKDGFIDCEIPGVADLNYVSSQTRRGRVVENGNICPTLCAENVPDLIEFGDPDFYNFLYEIDGEIYLIRIRKLIPRECLRLMDVDEDVIDRMEKVESNTNLYKAAGNSIIVNCLVAIFGQMFEGKENVYKTICQH